MSWVEDTKFRLKFFAIALLFMGPGFLFWLAPSLQQEYDSYSWPAVDGEVVVVIPKPTGERRHDMPTYIGRVHYKYLVNGVEYASNMTNFVNGPSRTDPAAAAADFGQFHMGDKVTVFYDPQDPNTAVIEQGIPANHAVVAVAMVLATIVGAIVTVATIRSWQRSRDESTQQFG